MEREKDRKRGGWPISKLLIFKWDIWIMLCYIDYMCVCVYIYIYIYIYIYRERERERERERRGGEMAHC